MDQPHPSYSRGSQDKSLLAMTIGQAFDHTVAQYPDGEALVWLDGLNLAAFQSSVRKAVDQKFGAKYGELYKAIEAVR